MLEHGVQAFLATVEATAQGLNVRSADQRLALLCRVLDNAANALENSVNPDQDHGHDHDH